MISRRTGIILVIIFSVLTLVYILLSYFGILRYISLSMNNSDNYIQNYSNLRKGGKNRVVISFTTTPEYIKHIRPMLNSILDQTVKVDQIALIVPYNYQGQKYNIPDYIKKIVNIFPAGKDYGEGTKIIPILFREKECDTIIIALSDKYVYGKTFIETIIEEVENNPKTVLVDNKNTTITLRPEYFGCDVINRDKDKFDQAWFLDKAKKSKVIYYGENYKII